MDFKYKYFLYILIAIHNHYYQQMLRSEYLIIKCFLNIFNSNYLKYEKKLNQHHQIQ